MAKDLRVRYHRSPRQETPFQRRPNRYQHTTSPNYTRGFLTTPKSPSEFFVTSLRTDEKTALLDSAVLGPGAEVLVKIAVYVEETPYIVSAKSQTFALVVHVQAPLPTGGTYRTQLESWGKDGPEPTWLVGVLPNPSHPLRFTHSLGWLYAVVSAIEARPARLEGDTWCRLLRFVKDVKEAYRFAPPLETHNDSKAQPRPRPRPRPRHGSGLNDLVEALKALRLDDAAELDGDVGMLTDSRG